MILFYDVTGSKTEMIKHARQDDGSYLKSHKGIFHETTLIVFQ